MCRSLASFFFKLHALTICALFNLTLQNVLIETVYKTVMTFLMGALLPSATVVAEG